MVHLLKVHLIAQGLWKVVSGEILEPPGSMPLDRDSWIFDDATAITILMGAMDERQQKHVQLRQSAKGVWDAQKEIHGKDSRTRLVPMLRRFHTYKAKEEEGVDETAAELEDMRDIIAKINPEVKPSDIMMALVLMDSVDHERYNAVKLQLNDLENLTFDKDKCHRCGNKHSDTCKFIITECTGCGKIGHIERACNSKRGKEKDDDSDVERKKIFCVLTTHSPPSTDSFVFPDTAEEDGSNIKHPETNINKTFQTRKFLCTINYSIPISKPVDLLINSGATDHALCNKDLFEPGFYRIMLNKLETGSGEVLKTEGRGSLSLLLKNETGFIREFVLTDVLYTPDMNFNLISTARLAQKGVEIFLRKAGELSKIYYEEEVIGHAKLIDNQYVIQTTPNSRALATTKNISIQTWHARMGHLGYHNLLKLNQLATGALIIGPVPEEICGDCMVGRQQRLVNRSPRSRDPEFLGIIHTDLGGPYTPTRYGERYFMTLKDDATGVVWVFLLKTKGQTLDKFKQFKAWIEKQSGQKIKHVRGDGGGEYVNTELLAFFKRRRNSMGGQSSLHMCLNKIGEPNGKIPP